MGGSRPDPVWVVEQVREYGSVEVGTASLQPDVDDWRDAVTLGAQAAGLTVVFVDGPDVVTVVDVEH